MKDVIFLANLTQRLLFPSNLKKLVSSKATSAKAAACFLDEMIGPAIECSNIEPFNLLLTTMKQSDNINLKKLAENITKEIQGMLRNEPVSRKYHQRNSGNAEK